jgi:hypothetical protein
VFVSVCICVCMTTSIRLYQPFISKEHNLLIQLGGIGWVRSDVSSGQMVQTRTYAHTHTHTNTHTNMHTHVHTLALLSLLGKSVTQHTYTGIYIHMCKRTYILTYVV